MMIYHTNNILAGPLVLIIWCIDAYIFLASVRLILGRLRATTLAQVRVDLQQFTDPLPQSLHMWMSARLRRPLRPWMSWAIVLFGCIVLRHVLIWIVLMLR